MVQGLHKIKAGSKLDDLSYRKLIWGVERVFDVVRVLLHPATAEEKNKYQVYLMFYGLETSGEGKLALHPKLKPRCVQMIGAKNLFTTKVCGWLAVMWSLWVTCVVVSLCSATAAVYSIEFSSVTLLLLLQRATVCICVCGVCVCLCVCMLVCVVWVCVCVGGWVVVWCLSV